MARISLGRGALDVFDVTEFAEAAYRGDRPSLKALLEKTPAYRTDAMAYYLALRANDRETFSFLLQLNVEYPGSLYGFVLFERPEFLALLPHNEEQLKRAEGLLPTFRMNQKLIEGTLTASELRDLIFNGANARSPVLLAAAELEFFPVHLAAMRPDLKLMKELVRAGVEPKMLSPDGKNAVRMVYENTKLSRRERKDFVKFFTNNQKSPLPALTAAEKILLFFGLPLPPRTLPRETSSSDSRSS